MIVRIRELQPGDVILRTGEVVKRTFTDALTPRGGIEVLMLRGDRERLATYKRADKPLNVVRRD